MSLIFSFLLLPYLFILAAGDSTVMVIVWGEPSTYTSYENFTSWDDCLDECYGSDDCVLVYQVSSGCELFRFGNLTTVRKSNSTDAKIVAFRKTLSNATCPSNNNPPLFGANSTSEIYKVNQTLYNSTVTSDDDTWTIAYSTVTCPNNTKPFARSSVSVCIGVRYFNGTGNYTEASSLCSTNGGISLTGPYSSDEATYLFGSTSLQLWVDGISTYTVQNFVMEDKTHNGTYAYPMASGQPDSETILNCFFKMRNVATADDYLCDMTLAGVMCRVSPESST